jgi:hypothetical protein
MDEKQKLEDELARLDNEWIARRESFLIKDKHGKLAEPTGVHLVPRVLVMVGSVVLMAFLSASELHPVFVYALLLPFSVATFQLLSGAGKSDKFDRERSIYESQRSAIIRKMTNGQ